MSKKLVIAVDFDGTLCEYAFPGIGNQSPDQVELVELLIKLRQEGHKLILWTNRGDNEQYKSLTEAVEWCKQRGLEFDAVNENLPNQKKLSGYSPKIMADCYIDDKAMAFGSDKQSRRKVLNFLSNESNVNQHS
jgi:hypothetical protein